VRVLVAALALVMIGAVGGCGHGSGRAAGPTLGAQPRASGGFVSGTFEQIPKYPSSEPLGATSETAGTVARTYKVAGATPRDVLQWYRDHLTDWTVVTVPQAVEPGAVAVRGVWTKNSTTLTITADNAPTLKSPEAAEQNVVQYSLSLTGASGGS
jgi:hypothetical protein